MTDDARVVSVELETADGKVYRLHPVEGHYDICGLCYFQYLDAGKCPHEHCGSGYFKEVDNG